jgi:23S rRNA maturation mini-RNase III
MSQEKIRNHLKNKDAVSIIHEINECTNEHELSSLISFLKRKEFLIDKRGDNSHRDTIKCITKNNPMTSKYSAEIEIINLLFSEDKRLQDLILNIPKVSRVSSLLQVIENQNTQFNWYFKNKHKKLIQKNIDVFEWHTNVMIVLNKTFKTLIYQNDIVKNNIFNFDFYRYNLFRKSFNVCLKYLHDSFTTSQWEDLYKLWKSGYAIYEKTGDIITVKLDRNAKLEWILKSFGKDLVYSRIEENELALISKHYPLTFVRNPHAKTDDVFATAMVKKYLHSDDLDTQISGIAAKYWLEFYSAIIRYSRNIEWINSLGRSSILRIILKRYLQVKSKTGWMRIITRNGMPNETAQRMLDLMTYSTCASDLYDYPFVKVKNRYWLASFLLTNGAAGKILISRFEQRDINTERGINFEVEVRKTLLKKGIPSVELRKKMEGKEYQCDLAFFIDDVLFLCELKDGGNNKIAQYDSSFYEDDIPQVNRICDFYEKHLDFVVDCFKKAKFKLPSINKCIRLLIYNAYFHSSFKIDKVLVTDYITFIASLRRGDLDLRICDKFNGPSHLLKGRYTATSFLKYLKTSFAVCNHDKIFSIKDQQLNVGKFTIQCEAVVASPLEIEDVLSILSPAVDFVKEYHKKKT